MKNLFKLITFLIYTLGIFFIKPAICLVIPLVVNIVFILSLKINLKKILKNILQISILVIITVFFNLLMDSIENSLMVGARLLLVCNSTYIFAYMFSYNNLASAIELLIKPFKFLGINPKDTGLMVCMGVAFIPILTNELEQIKNVLKVKGFNMTPLNIAKNLNLIFKPFFISIFERVNELENTLKSKAY